MANEIKVTAQKRGTSGTTAARRLRREGLIPAILNNDKGETSLIQLNGHAFDLMLRHHRSESLLLSIVIDDAPAKMVLLKEVQRGPVRGEIVHVDFLEVSQTKKMHVTIPIVLVGEPIGVRDMGGILDQMLRSVEVSCLPGDLVEQIEVDISGMNLGDTLMVSAIPPNPKLTILTHADVALASVVAPQAEEVVAAATEEGSAAAEPEVIAKKKAEDEEGEAPASDAKAGGKEKAPAGKEKAAGKDGGDAKKK